LCNKDDWRLPTAKELASILAVDPYLSEEEYRYYGMVDRDYFYVGNDQGIGYQTAENISYLFPAGFYNNSEDFLGHVIGNFRLANGAYYLSLIHSRRRVLLVSGGE
jgi:hypothetical protein